MRDLGGAAQGSFEGVVNPKRGVIGMQALTTAKSPGVRLTRWAGGAMAVVVLLGLGWLLWSVSRTFEPTLLQRLRALMTAISVPVLLLWSHNRERMVGRLRKLSWAIVLTIIVAFGAGTAMILYRNLQQPPVWDFLSFWLNGQVAIRGLNFYQPAHYQMVSLPIPPGPTFTAEILEVGFWYPPPSMILFMPLGLFDIRTGLIVWYAAQGASLAMCILLIWKAYFGRTNLAGLVLASAFVAVMAGTLTTLEFAQTNFLALLMVLLFWLDRGRKRGGMWLVIGAIVKPFLLLLVLVPILRKNVQVLLGAFMTLVVVCVLTIGLFGVETTRSYFTDNPTSRLAGFIYTEVSNQSLLATVLRLDPAGITGKPGLGYPLYIGLVILMTGLTCWLVSSLRGDSSEWGIGLVLMLALVVYPASQFFYSVLLVVPLMMLWEKRDVIAIGAWGAGALITVVYVLAVFPGYVFVANLLLWTALAGFVAWSTLKGKPALAELRGGFETASMRQRSGSRA